jgi:hypothetical protein
MPGSWDPQVYRERAKAWQEKADVMKPGKTRDATLALAEGYAKLADLIERDRLDRDIGWAGRSSFCEMAGGQRGGRLFPIRSGHNMRRCIPALPPWPTPLRLAGLPL